MHDRVNPPSGKGKSRAAWTFFVTALGLFIVFLDISIVNVALVNISSGMRVGVTDLEWIVDAYTVAFAGCLLTAGAMGDRLGNKGIFLLGIVLFTASSLICGMAPNLAILISGRVMQGIGAAMIIPSSLTLLNHTYDDPHERAKAFGSWGACGAIAIASGPLFGGLLIHAFNWRSIFLVNIPIGIAAVVLGGVQIKKEKHVTNRGIDFAGLITSLISLTALVAALVEGPRFGWTSWPVIAFGVSFALFAVSWILIEAKHPNPMLPLRLFGVREFSVVCLVGLIGNIAMYGALFTLSLYLQEVRHLTPFQTGLMFLPNTTLIAIGNASSGKLAVRFGGRMPVIIGLSLAGLAYGWLAITATDHASLVLVIMQMALIGMGISLVVPPMVAICLASVDKTQVGLASGAFNTSRQIGTAAGVALLGSFLAVPSRFVPGFSLGLIIAAAFCFIGVALILVFVGPMHITSQVAMPGE